MYGIPVETAIVMILGFSRLFGFVYFFPIIGGDQVPPMVRAVLCMGLTPYVAMPQIGVPLDAGAQDWFLLLLVKEALVGSFLGLLTGLPLRLPEIIGSMIDNQRGSAVTDTYNPMSGSDASLLGQLLALTIGVYFFTAGGFGQIVAMLAGSFKLVPLDSFTITTGENAWRILLEVFMRYLSVFMILTLPVMCVMFMTEIALAVASRFAQSLNVFALAMPLKSLMAIAMLVTLLPLINRNLLSFVQDLLRRFGGGG